MTPRGEVKWRSHRGGDANDERRRLIPSLFVFLVFSCLYKAVTIPAGLAVRTDLAFSVESIDFLRNCSVFEIGVVDEGLVLNAG